MQKLKMEAALLLICHYEAVHVVCYPVSEEFPKVSYFMQHCLISHQGLAFPFNFFMLFKGTGTEKLSWQQKICANPNLPKFLYSVIGDRIYSLEYTSL